MRKRTLSRRVRRDTKQDERDPRGCLTETGEMRMVLKTLRESEESLKQIAQKFLRAG